MAHGNFILDKGYDVAVAVTKFTAVKRTSTAEQVAPATAPTDIVLGVAQYGVTLAAIAQGKGCSVRERGKSEMLLGGTVARNDEVTIDSLGRAVNITSLANDSLATGVVADNNALTWTAKDADVTDITITYVDPPGNNGALSVDVDGHDIVVTGATDGSSALTSTGTLVIAAIAEHDGASQLVTVTNRSTSNGSGVVAAFAQSPLTGNTAAGSRVIGVCDLGGTVGQYGTIDLDLPGRVL